MEKYIFLYKENTDDRDCCAYIKAKAERFECGHYFGGVTLCGACYSGGNFADYKDITTVLTENEYNQLIQFNKDIEELGYGINKGDERYNKGIELCKAIKPVYDKLLSEENENLFNEIIEEEKEYLMDEYGFDEDDIETIFNKYSLDYRDRAIVGYVYEDTYDLGYEQVDSLGYLDGNTFLRDYFDFEKFGEDLVNGDDYCKLADGRCVSLNY